VAELDVRVTGHGANDGVPGVEDIVEVLVAERDITRVLHRYCAAVDGCDEVSFRAVYHDDATDDHGTYTGSATGFVSYALERLRGMYVATQHTLTNIVIDVDLPGSATSESYICATHLLRPEHGGGIFWFTGRYLDRFERREGTWRIAHRQMIRTWDHVEARSRALPGAFALAEPTPFTDRTRDEGWATADPAI
jgi:hypothetical protein